MPVIFVIPESGLSGEDDKDSSLGWIEDVNRLDEIIDRFLPIALNAEEDFDRALRAS